MAYLDELDDEDLEKIVCPECEEKGFEEEHNIFNFVIGMPLGIVGGVIFYYADIPFGPKYVCDNCDYELDDGDLEENGSN